jgi:hypothetical protein
MERRRRTVEETIHYTSPMIARVDRACGRSWLKKRVAPPYLPLPGVRPTLRIPDDEVRSEGLPVLGDRRLERLGDVLTFGQDVIRQSEPQLDHVIDPGLMDCRVRPLAILVIFPLIERQPKVPDQLFPLGRIVFVEPLRKDPLQHRDRKKRPGNLDQRKPFGVVTGRGHENPSRGGWPGPNPGGEVTGMLIVGG